MKKEIVLWDPLPGDHIVVAVPLELDNEERTIWNGAVLCAAAGDPSHVHGGFSCCPFKVALAIGASLSQQLCPSRFTVLLILAPLSAMHLDLIEWPSGATDSRGGSCHILLTEDGSLGLAILPCDSLQIWERKVRSECVAQWVLQKTYNLCKVHGMGPGPVSILGYAEDTNVMLLWSVFGVYMLQIDFLQSKKLWKLISYTDIIHTQVSMVQVIPCLHFLRTKTIQLVTVLGCCNTSTMLLKILVNNLNLVVIVIYH
uniref:Uncharacterized protein n=1 Tax=Setaria viridis TaxID=4556 RepID=A0A4U6U728_SETVI|nr:hypothetical protein SEVIR_6G099300v2 [Setaria viridis]